MYVYCVPVDSYLCVHAYMYVNTAERCDNIRQLFYC